MKYEPGLIQINKHDEHLMALMAMWMNLGLGGRRSWARCNNGNKRFSQELEQKKESRLNSVG
jgi:hypothetical protein